MVLLIESTSFPRPWGGRGDGYLSASPQVFTTAGEVTPPRGLPGGTGLHTLKAPPCTDNFTKEEVLILIGVLDKKFGIKAYINKRTKGNGDVC